ncbi:MAG: ATP-binding protein [Candidatus Contendobacter sp.]|nr:ATP-binding protein [Candidatus Contendobacter sp.]
MRSIISEMYSQDFEEAVKEDKESDLNASLVIKKLEEIESSRKNSPASTIKDVINKISALDFNKLFYHLNKESSVINRCYRRIQRNKCAFCEQRINSNGQFYHKFNPAFLSFNGNISFYQEELSKIAVPCKNIDALCLICHDCHRASRFLYVYSKPEEKSDDKFRIFFNPLKTDFEILDIFRILDKGQITEIPISDLEDKNPRPFQRHWAPIHEMNLNRPYLVEQRKKIHKKTLEQIGYLKNLKKTSGLDAEIHSKVHDIFSIDSSYTLASYSALKDIFGKAKAGLGTHQDGSYQIDDFIRAYEYLEEVKCYPKLAEDSWRPELVTKVHLQESYNIQLALDDLRQNFIRWLDEVPLQSQDYLPPYHPPLPMRPPRFIRSFSIANYRGLTTQEIHLDPPRSTSKNQDTAQAAVPVPDAAFLADNAAGKTRLLQALVWALAGDEDIKIFRKRVPERYHPKGTTITINFFDRPKTEQLLVKFPDDFPNTGQYTRKLGGKDYRPRIPVLAFGSNRAPATEPEPEPEPEPESRKNSSPPKEYFIECAMTLFRRDSHVPHPLHHLPFEKFEWFKPNEQGSQDDLKVRAIRWLLDGLCPPEAREANTRKVRFEPLKTNQDQSHNQPRAKLELGGGDQPVPFENWSEGFQTVYTLALAVIFDMMAEDSGAPAGAGLQTTMSGIVLIDEFDAHLHPRWRVNILKQMKAVFPNVQFIFTTHDPVILRGMPTSNVFRLPAPKNGKVTPTNLKEATYLTGFEIDDLLISELFNMDILRDEEEAEYYERYLDLLLKKAHADRAAGKPEKAEKHPELSNEEKTELDFLRRRCGGGYAGLGHPRDKLILPVIDTIYAEYLNNEPSRDETNEYIDTVKKLLVEIWNR